MVKFEDSPSTIEHPCTNQSVPVVREIIMLENQLKEKKREVRAAQSEIKALKATDAAKDRALEELQNGLNKMDERLRASEKLVEQKNIEINKLVSDRKDALAAQFAAEATLRRVYVNQKHTDSVHVASLVAPLEAEIKTYKNEITSLREDKKALERLTKSKEVSLVEAEKILKMALERVLIVEEVQNQNMDLRRQIEICLEENKILSKANRQKVVDVDKLSQTVRELEEAILAGGSAANALRDCQRKISELNEEKRVLERELSRAQVAANRVATVVASEWKEETDKVMPVRQWIEERKLLLAEMQRLRDRLLVSERTAKAESQLRKKLQVRFKTLEDGLKSESFNTDKPNKILGISSDKAAERKRSSFPQRASRESQSPLKQTNNFRTDAFSKSSETEQKENRQENSGNQPSKFTDDDDDGVASTCTDAKQTKNKVDEINGDKNSDGQDVVSGFLYDRLQKEVINLRKLCVARESLLSSKDEEMKILTRKVNALKKSIEVESRKIKREIMALPKADDNRRNQNLSLSKRFTKTPA